MAGVHVPAAGLALSHSPLSAKGVNDEATQIIRLDVVESITKDILRSLRDNEDAVLRLGKKAVLNFGTKKLSLQVRPDLFPSEIYHKSFHDESSMYFSGRLSHTLEIQSAQEATAKSDEALATLENTLKSMQELRASNETSFVRSKDEMKQIGKRNHKPPPLLRQPSAVRKDNLSGNMARSTPQSPYLSAAYSPRHGPTSAPLPASGGNSVKDRIRLDAIKIPLLHLLAFRPMTPKAIAEKLRVSKDDCDKVIDKYARDCKAVIGKKELKEKSFRELDVWKFPYQNRDDRQAAIDHAIHAFDRMRIEKTDPLWQMLLRPEERGKGKTLSRLNFDKPVPRPSTPKTEHRLSDDAKADLSDAEAAKARMKKQSSDTKGLQKPAAPKAPGKETGLKPSKSLENARSSNDKTTQHAGRSSKADGKFKSAERIIDSDEEIEEAEGVPAKPITSLKRKQPSPNKAAQSPRKDLHKSNLSNSSSGNERSNRTETSSQSANRSLKPPSTADNSASKLSPRPRTGSSPQKPSPLGSSPPTNSTDAESSGSSKAPSQSSAPSSPPSSTDMPLAKKGNKYSPIISEPKHDVSRGRSPMKRPSDSVDDTRPAKRHQASDPSTNKLSNGVTQRPLLERKISDSERSSSPEKPGPNRDGVIGEAKRFQKYYQKYKDLHEKIAKIPEEERDDKEMEGLWKMHKRLKEMKSEILVNWEKVEEPLVG